MQTDFNTLDAQSEEIINLMIVDKNGRVIALNNVLKKSFQKLAPHTNFLDCFKAGESVLLTKIFGEAKKNEQTVKERIDLTTSEGIKVFDVSITPLKSENNIYFSINFGTEDVKSASTNLQKFKVATNEIINLAVDPKIQSVVEKIKLSYPFSFIEKAKIQKEVNEILDFFWLKDSDGKIILANESYANVLGLKPNQLENKNETEVLPKYLSDVLGTMDIYVRGTSNAIIMENITGIGFGGVISGVSMVQFPLLDLDNNVVAIIGFSKVEKYDKTIVKEVSTNVNYKTLPIPVCVINNKNIIETHSIELLRMFSLGEQINLDGQDASKIFEQEFLSNLEKIKDDKSIKEEIKFKYVFAERNNLSCDVKVNRYMMQQEQLLQIAFFPHEVNIAQLEMKSALYDSLIEHAPEAMFVYDIENLRFLEVNNQALKLYGYKRSDFLNMDLTDLYSLEDIQTLIETSDSKAPAGAYSGPWRHKKSDGTYVYVELRRTSLDFKGRKSHLNLVRNISENIDEKKKLQLLDTLYENISDAILITDKDGFIKDINDVAVKKLGYPKRDLETRPIITLLGDDDRAIVNKNVFHSGLLKTINSEVEIKKPSGTFHKATIISTPIKNYNGEVDSYSFIVRLIEEAAPVKDLQHTQVDAADKIDSSFLSNMFHEILTPINVILGFTQELGDSIEEPNDEQKEAMDIIKENQKLLLQIMDNAVEYSTLEQKVIKFRPEEFKFTDLLNELKDQTKKAADSKKIDLDFSNVASSLIVETDRQKFVYLLSLFIKFAIQIAKEKSLFISAEKYDDKHFSVGIRDDKTGISQHLAKSLTDILSDDDNVSRRNYGFSRFSVRLAKKLLELLSVKKDISSKANQAEEFALLIPIKFSVADLSNVEIEQSPAKEIIVPKINKKIEIVPKEKYELPTQKIHVELDKQIDLTQLSCLYLEDQLDSQMLFRFQMKELKLLEFAVSFETALPLLKTKKFDFIVMDINLQGEYNGLDALRIIQKMPGYKEIPIIASTAYVQPDARAGFISAGFTDFISKPLLRDKLIEVLKRLF